MRVCSVCEKHKSDSAYYAGSGRCKPCYRNEVRERQKGYRKPDGSQKRSNLKKNYGISLEEFEALLAKQDNLCGVCGDPFEEGNWKLTPSVDHDHTTGAIRGLLCRTCNTGMGMLRDDPEIIEKAVLWLRRDS